MKLERAQRLRMLWNYLPAFRAVAEAQHLPTAARVMALSPPALSRSLRLLEEAIGQPLFERRGRNLRLNPNGEALLVAVRTGMRVLDDALQSFQERTPAVVRVAVAPETSWVLGAWASTCIASADGFRWVAFPTDVTSALLRGDVDVVVHGSHRVVGGLEIERIADVTWRMFRGRRGRPRSKLKDIVMATAPGDPWPSSVRREIAIEVDQITTAAEIATRGRFSAFVPEPLARHLDLRPCAGPTIETPLFVSTRTPITKQLSFEHAIARLRKAVC